MSAPLRHSGGTRLSAVAAPLGRSRRPDRGQVAIELLGAIPYLVLGILAVLQLTFAVSAVQATSAAARAGARAVSQGDEATSAARAAVPSWLRDKLTVAVGGGTAPGVSVSAPVPIVLPGFDGPTVTRRAWFEPEQGPSPWG